MPCHAECCPDCPCPTGDQERAGVAFLNQGKKEYTSWK
jgi:hypothetical protein